MFTLAPCRPFAFAVALAAGLLACDDNDDPPLDESKIATIRLTVGTQTITIDENCVVSGGPIRISTGTTPVAASFLLANGTPDPIVTSADFQMNFTIANTGLASFTRTGAFNGTLTRGTAGNTTATVALFHFEDDDDDEHNDIACPNVALQVQ